MAYKPPTIEELGGIEPYLVQTSGKHHGRGFDEFETIVANFKAGLLSKAAAARMMNVDPRTFDNWVELLNKKRTAAQ